MHSNLLSGTKIEINRFYETLENSRQEIIKAKESFFPHSKIYLFGSRIDNSRSGGDIDLYLLSENRCYFSWTLTK